uniref:Uncharacterized protein n=1 Tax=Magnetococcus massalia (strain MO-1) TaxID=451514 RepID=A0A1S7LE42_MAGMO|nr:protein of unknown function [Candidatus Magnetococcus massalia]
MCPAGHTHKKTAGEGGCNYGGHYLIIFPLKKNNYLYQQQPKNKNLKGGHLTDQMKRHYVRQKLPIRAANTLTINQSAISK